MAVVKLRGQADLALKLQEWSKARDLYAKLQVTAGGAGAKDESFFASYALACLKQEDFPEACKLAREAIKLGSKTAYFLRGCAIMELAIRRQNLRTAELRYAQRDFRKSVEFFPEDAPAWQRLSECDAFLADLEANPPNFFPSDMRDDTTQPQRLRNRRRAAFLAEDFQVLEESSRKRWDEEWLLHGARQKEECGAVKYAPPPNGFEDDPDFPVGAVYVANRDGKLPGSEVGQFLAVWKVPDSGEQQEEPFRLKSLGIMVVEHLTSGRLLNLGPSSDDFCLIEPGDFTSKRSSVGFDANTFWTAALLWKVLGTTGIKPWDEEIAALNAEGIPELADQILGAETFASEAKRQPTSSDESAADLKAAGNGHFKEKRWQEACRSYEMALSRCTASDEDELRVALHSNLAQCYLNLQLFRRALDSATECLQLDWRNQKALFRRASAYEKLKEYDKALGDLEHLLKSDPAHVEARKAVDRLQKLSRPPSEKSARSKGNISASIAASNFDAFAPSQDMVEGSTSWCEGLQLKDCHRCFVDCYRLRLDDDCGGLEVNVPSRRGLYAPSAKRGIILEDWLVFCRLATFRCLLPADWSWSVTLDLAAERLCVTLGGDQLRFVAPRRLVWLRKSAQVVYASDGEVDRIRQEVKHGLQTVDPHLFDETGGSGIWRQLLRKLPEKAT